MWSDTTATVELTAVYDSSGEMAEGDDDDDDEAVRVGLVSNTAAYEGL